MGCPLGLGMSIAQDSSCELRRLNRRGENVLTARGQMTKDGQIIGGPSLGQPCLVAV
jgi:hypothetical protein